MRRTVMVALAALAAGATILLTPLAASAHVVPSTTVALDVHETNITAQLTLPATDLATASGVTISPDGTIDADTAEQLAAYLEDHLAVASDSDQWDVSVADVAEEQTEQWGTGTFTAVTATATLTPSITTDLRAFTLDYDAIIHQVVTADIFVTLHSDWAAGELDSARDLGTITLDTITGTIAPLTINLDDGNAWHGFVGMVTLGISHIAEGTDHQLFLLTLLLPAPLFALRRRWNGVVPIRTAIRRITTITLAFTIGHSATLALGVLGLPVLQQPIEALIAVSILIAAAHAIRPLFAGREALVAGIFGLIHGMAFSTTLTELDLSGGQLVLSLLGFNLGIEIMQLAVVALVLPALIILARTRIYRPVRISLALLTATAAAGWLLQRVGLPTALGAAADAIGPASPWILLGLWILAGITIAKGARCYTPTAVNGQSISQPSGEAPTSVVAASRSSAPQEICTPC